MTILTHSRSKHLAKTTKSERINIKDRKSGWLKENVSDNVYNWVHFIANADWLVLWLVACAMCCCFSPSIMFVFITILSFLLSTFRPVMCMASFLYIFYRSFSVQTKTEFETFPCPADIVSGHWHSLSSYSCNVWQPDCMSSNIFFIPTWNSCLKHNVFGWLRLAFRLFQYFLHSQMEQTS